MNMYICYIYSMLYMCVCVIGLNINKYLRTYARLEYKKNTTKYIC